MHPAVFAIRINKQRDFKKDIAKGRFSIMKLTITLNASTEEIVLPIHHNHFIQAAIYKLLDPAYASFLHEQGYVYQKRQFRLFSFSRLLGKYKLNRREGTIVFFNPINLVVLSPLKLFSKDLVNSLVLGKKIRLGTQELEASEIVVDFPQVKERDVRVRTLSPIVVYSTVERADGRKFTNYFEPTESEFSRIVSSNLYKKRKAWEPDWMLPENEFDFSIKPLGRTKRHLVMYKSNVIKGHSGIFLIQGEPEYLEFALNVGLGSKGAQGFGAIERYNG